MSNKSFGLRSDLAREILDDDLDTAREDFIESLSSSPQKSCGEYSLGLAASSWGGSGVRRPGEEAGSLQH